MSPGRDSAGGQGDGGGGGTVGCLFRDRLDYAFTPACAGGGACYRKCNALSILVPAPSIPMQPVYESLQGRPEVGPLPTPRRYLAPPSRRVRLHRCEPRLSLHPCG